MMLFDGSTPTMTTPAAFTAATFAAAPGDPCPCGRTSATGKNTTGKQRTTPLPFARCCAPILQGTQLAADAETLMRSRYTAYVLCNTGWLLQSWHPSTRPNPLELEPETRWLGLEVKAHKAIDVTHAEVHFVARYKIQGRAWRLEERSRFVCENGQWFYLDAIAAPA